MVRIVPIVAGVLVLLAVTACGHRATHEVTSEAASTASSVKAVAKTDASQIRVTESDITDKKYVTLGDVSVSVSKNTIFDSDPTKAMVEEELKKQAAEMGADAVVFARFGSVGISLFSWGVIEGKGRAVKFAN